MKFEWDKNKNKANEKKHGIQFETASLVFQDPDLLCVLDYRYSEERWQGLGLMQETVIYLAHTIREDEYGEEIIRIISARAAISSECQRYYANSKNAQTT